MLAVLFFKQLFFGLVAFVLRGEVPARYACTYINKHGTDLG